MIRTFFRRSHFRTRLRTRDLFKGAQSCVFLTKGDDIFIQVINFEGVGGDAKEIFYCLVVFVVIYGICTYL